MSQNQNNQDSKSQKDLISNQASYKLLYWVLPVVVILALLGYWMATSTPSNKEVQKPDVKSAMSASVNSVPNSNQVSKPSQPPQSTGNSPTISKNISIISNNGLVIPNLKATIDGKEFVAKDNQINIQIESAKANLPVTITGEGYTTIKSDKLEQLTALVQMTVNIPKSVEPVVIIPAPAQVQQAPSPQVLSNRVVYTSDKDGIVRLYSSKSDGSDPKLLSGDLSVGNEVITKGGDAWFRYNPNGDTATIYKVDINNGGLNKVTQFREFEEKDGNSQQISFDAASGKRIKILETSFSNPTDTFISRLWVSNADGSNEKLVRERVYKDGYERVSGWKISPDGNKISYVLNKFNKSNIFVQSRVLVVDINNPNNFRTQWTDTNPNFNIREIGFSGDNRYHLYATYDSGTQKSSTYIFDMSNTSFKEIKNLYAGYGQFTADGKSYILSDIRDDKTNLFKINLSDATVSQLTTSGTVGAFYVNGNDIYLKQSKKVYYLTSHNQLVESKIETDNSAWSIGGQYFQDL